MTKKKVKFGALPTENMPKKSHETPKPLDIPTSIEKRKYYTGLKDVCKRIKALKAICEWTVKERIDRVILRKIKDCFQLPEYPV